MNIVTELAGFNHFPCSFLMFVKCYPLLVGANPYDLPRYSGDSIKGYNASTSETLIYAQDAQMKCCVTCEGICANPQVRYC